MNKELIKIIEENGINTVNARDLHKFLEVKKDFSDWIKLRIEKYGFVENEDFTSILGKSSGGRQPIEYHISIDMAKEIAMVENNERGKQARRYFIECEKQLHEKNARLLGKPIRMSLTDRIQDSGLNEEMHGFAYKSFTDLVYIITIGSNCAKYKKDHGLDKDCNIRDHLSGIQLKSIARVEKIIESLIDAGYEYQEIKSMLFEKFLYNDQGQLEVK